MHGAVRKLNRTAYPPVLNVSKVNDQPLIVDYHSKRKIGSLAMGLIKGIAKYYDEQEDVNAECITARDAENVQIKVHFDRKIAPSKKSTPTVRYQ